MDQELVVKKLRCHGKGQRRGGVTAVDLAGKEAKGRAQALSPGRKLVKEPFADEVKIFIPVFGLKVLFEGDNV